jgi:hypothetical protein
MVAVTVPAPVRLTDSGAVAAITPVAVPAPDRSADSEANAVRVPVAVPEPVRPADNGAAAVRVPVAVPAPVRLAACDELASTTVKVPLARKVWIVYRPLVVFVPPVVAAESMPSEPSVLYRMTTIPLPPLPDV